MYISLKTGCQQKFCIFCHFFTFAGQIVYADTAYNHSCNQSSFKPVFAFLINSTTGGETEDEQQAVE